MSVQNTERPELIGPEGPFNDYAASYVPVDHLGSCALTYSGRTGQHWVIFPSREAAITAAVGACRYDVGGYSDVAIFPVSEAPPGTEEYRSVTDWLFDGDDIPQVPLEQPGVIAIVRRLMGELAKRIAAEPHELPMIEWRDLERLLFEVFDALGFDAKLTRPAKDGGFDLKLRADGLTYLVEVKHWSEGSKVGKGIVDRFTEVVVSNDAEGLMIATSGFTEKAIKARSKVTQYPVILGSSLKIISLCRLYVQTAEGLWIPEGGLRDVLFEGGF